MTAHRPAQIVRLSAIVISGAASLCLTFAAGAYIVNHMPELGPPPAHDQAEPTATPNPGPHRPFSLEDSAPHAGVELAMSFGAPTLTTERSEPAATRTPITAQQSGVGARPANSPLTGRVGIGGTYVGAQVAPPRSDSVSFTVDTNLVTVAAKYLGLTPDPAAVTALHTEFDARRGGGVRIVGPRPRQPHAAGRGNGHRTSRDPQRRDPRHYYGIGRRRRRRRSTAVLDRGHPGYRRRVTPPHGTSSGAYDFCVVGGGIVGVATAHRLLTEYPDASLVLIEKEAALGAHQTGHNSGVIHSGIYYPRTV